MMHGTWQWAQYYLQLQHKVQSVVQQQNTGFTLTFCSRTLFSSSRERMVWVNPSIVTLLMFLVCPGVEETKLGWTSARIWMESIPRTVENPSTIKRTQGHLFFLLKDPSPLQQTKILGLQPLVTDYWLLTRCWVSLLCGFCQTLSSHGLHSQIWLLLRTARGVQFFAFASSTSFSLEVSTTWIQPLLFCRPCCCSSSSLSFSHSINQHLNLKCNNRK